MMGADACTRCGVRLEAPDSAALPTGESLLADLCTDCLEALWDTVMARLVARRPAYSRNPGTGETRPT
jgi:hypothetical protein